MSTMGGVQCNGGHIMSTVGGVEYTGGYHDKCGGYHEYVHLGMFSTLGFPYKFSCFPNDLPTHLS